MRTREQIEADVISVDGISENIDEKSNYGKIENNALLRLEVLLDIRDGLELALTSIITKLNTIISKL